MRWTIALQQDPAWKKFNKEKMIYTLAYDALSPAENDEGDVYRFDEKTAKEHALLLCYAELISGMNAITQCEYYFRRFPFKDLPVSHQDYLTRNCEVFFNKIYELRERIKNLGAALKEVSPAKFMDTGKLIKQYDKRFKNELKERNLLNHHTKFNDIELNRFNLVTTMEEAQLPLPFGDSSHAEYRRIWSAVAQMFLVKISEFLLETCDFLDN